MHRLVTENFYRHASYAPALTPGMQTSESPGLKWIDSGLPTDTFNLIIITDASGLELENLSRPIQHFRAAGRPYCLWISDQVFTAVAAERFEKLGLVRAETGLGMVLDFSAFTSLPHPGIAKHIRVQSAQDMSTYAAIIAANWTPPCTAVKSYYQQTLPQQIAPDSPAQMSLAYANGKAVSSIESFPTDQHTLGIYGFCTLTDYRRKGIGSGLFHATLAQGKAAGYQRAVLIASEAGAGIYQRSGFRTVCKFFEYVPT